MNVELLKDKMKSKDVSIKKMAQMLGIDQATLYRKFNKRSMEISEARIVVEQLGLNIDEANDIFFCGVVAKMRL